MKDVKVLIVPDVHGRTFWVEPVKEVLNENPDAKIIFLGDYLSPYTFYENITKEMSIDVFKDIIELAKNNSNIKLLIGNHDGAIVGPSDVCLCRLDFYNRADNRRLFLHNTKLFDICYETTINNKTFLLSHAGYTNKWLDYIRNINPDYLPKDFSKIKLSDFLNNKFHLTFESDKEYDNFWEYMGLYDKYRGGVDLVASILWTDCTNLINSKDKPKDIIQVVGHSQLKVDGVNYNDEVYLLDCKKCFYINSNGEMFEYLSNKSLLKYDLA